MYYTPMAVVIDNHLPREPLISSYVMEHTMVIASPLSRSVVMYTKILEVNLFAFACRHQKAPHRALYHL